MHYLRDERQVRLTVGPGLVCPDGTRLDDARLRRLSKLPGKSIRGEPVDSALVLFVLELEAQLFLPTLAELGIGCATFRNGREVIVLDTGGAQARSTPRGTLMPRLRAEGWPHREQFVHRGLFGSGPGPWLSFGFERRDRFDLVATTPEDSTPLASVEAQALANLGQKVDPALAPSAVMPGIVGLQDAYAAELLLLPERRRALERALRTTKVLFAIPKVGVLLGASRKAPGVGTLVRLAAAMFDEAAPHERLCREVIALRNGVPVRVESARGAGARLMSRLLGARNV